jgi:hypothetical protein
MLAMLVRQYTEYEGCVATSDSTLIPNLVKTFQQTLCGEGVLRYGADGHRRARSGRIDDNRSHSKLTNGHLLPLNKGMIVLAPLPTTRIMLRIRHMIGLCIRKQIPWLMARRFVF